jgi:hypothetical protein
MKRNTMLAAVSAAFVMTALATPVDAQTMKSVAGTYTLVANKNFGDNPRGLMILTPDGRYSNMALRATLPKIASGNRTKATAEENKAILDGSVTHYGRYTIDDGGKTLTLHIESSSYPNWDGTTQRRPLKVAGDELSYSVPAAASSAGVAPSEIVWKRIK